MEFLCASPLFFFFFFVLQSLLISKNSSSSSRPPLQCCTQRPTTQSIVKVASHNTMQYKNKKRRHQCTAQSWKQVFFPGNGIRHRDKSEREKEEKRHECGGDAERAREHVKAPSIKSNFSSRVCSYRLSVQRTLSFLLLLYNIVDCRDEFCSRRRSKEVKKRWWTGALEIWRIGSSTRARADFYVSSRVVPCYHHHYSSQMHKTAIRVRIDTFLCLLLVGVVVLPCALVFTAVGFYLVETAPIFQTKGTLYSRCCCWCTCNEFDWIEESRSKRTWQNSCVINQSVVSFSLCKLHWDDVRRCRQQQQQVTKRRTFSLLPYFEIHIREHSHIPFYSPFACSIAGQQLHITARCLYVVCCCCFVSPLDQSRLARRQSPNDRKRQSQTAHCRTFLLLSFFLFFFQSWKNKRNIHFPLVPFLLRCYYCAIAYVCAYPFSSDGNQPGRANNCATALSMRPAVLRCAALRWSEVRRETWRADDRSLSDMFYPLDSLSAYFIVSVGVMFIIFFLFSSLLLRERRRRGLGREEEREKSAAKW